MQELKHRTQSESTTGSTFRRVNHTGHQHNHHHHHHNNNNNNNNNGSNSHSHTNNNNSSSNNNNNNNNLASTVSVHGHGDATVTSAYIKSSNVDCSDDQLISPVPSVSSIHSNLAPNPISSLHQLTSPYGHMSGVVPAQSSGLRHRSSGGTRDHHFASSSTSFNPLSQECVKLPPLGSVVRTTIGKNASGRNGHRHTKRSPSERKFRCEHEGCDRMFFTRKDVKRHMVVHTGMRNFACPYCQQKFGRKDHLVRHAKKSHNRDTRTSASTYASLAQSGCHAANFSHPQAKRPVVHSAATGSIPSGLSGVVQIHHSTAPTASTALSSATAGNLLTGASLSPNTHLYHAHHAHHQHQLLQPPPPPPQPPPQQQQQQQSVSSSSTTSINSLGHSSSPASSSNILITPTATGHMVTSNPCWKSIASPTGNPPQPLPPSASSDHSSASSTSPTSLLLLHSSNSSSSTTNNNNNHNHNTSNSNNDNHADSNGSHGNNYGNSSVHSSDLTSATSAQASNSSFAQRALGHGGHRTQQMHQQSSPQSSQPLPHHLSPSSADDHISLISPLSEIQAQVHNLKAPCESAGAVAANGPTSSLGSSLNSSALANANHSASASASASARSNQLDSSNTSHSNSHNNNANASNSDIVTVHHGSNSGTSGLINPSDHLSVVNSSSYFPFPVPAALAYPYASAHPHHHHHHHHHAHHHAAAARAAAAASLYPSSTSGAFSTSPVNGHHSSHHHQNHHHHSHPHHAHSMHGMLSPTVSPSIESNDATSAHHPHIPLDPYVHAAAVAASSFSSIPIQSHPHHPYHHHPWIENPSLPHFSQAFQ